MRLQCDVRDAGPCIPEGVRCTAHDRDLLVSVRCSQCDWRGRRTANSSAPCPRCGEATRTVSRGGDLGNEKHPTKRSLAARERGMHRKSEPPLCSVFCSVCNDFHLMNDAFELHHVVWKGDRDEACFTCPHTGKRVTGLVVQ